MSAVPFSSETDESYRFRIMERKAIEEHKWYLSEKSGYDVGLSYAKYNWIMAGHRSRWLKHVYEVQNKDIN